jgi:hypothetical protein
MRTAVILPRHFESQFVYEAEKCGLATRIDMSHIIPNALSLEAEKQFDIEMYERCYAMKQKIFQMILLFDEIIIHGIMPTHEYSKLTETGFFSLSNLENFMAYPFENGLYDDCVAVSQYLKPALLPSLKKNIGRWYIIRDKRISIQKFVETIYDAVFEGVQNNNVFLLKKIENLLRLNEHEFYSWRELFFERYQCDEVYKDYERNHQTLWKRLAGEITYEYEHLNTILDISNKRDANIVNCEY